MSGDAPFAARELEVNGVRLHVVIEGSGPDVVLLHGFPDSHALWRHVIRPLAAAGYRVVAPDLRGYGASEAPAHRSSYRLRTLVADVVGLLDGLGIGTASLVGHDWGAVIGWQVCLSHPNRIARFAALSVGHPNAYATAGLEQRRRGYYVFVFQLAGVAEWLLRRRGWKALARACPGEAPNWIAALSRPGRLTAALNYYRANIWRLMRRDLRHVPMPVMGVWSSRDAALSETQMTRSADYVDGAWRYERLDNVRHWIPLEAPERLMPLLLDFLR